MHEYGGDIILLGAIKGQLEAVKNVQNIASDGEEGSNKYGWQQDHTLVLRVKNKAYLEHEQFRRGGGEDTPRGAQSS